MSEFSDSFHLYETDRARVRIMLGELEAPAAIVGENAKCVSFVVAHARGRGAPRPAAS